jgi:hypothetical protein
VTTPSENNLNNVLPSLSSFASLLASGKIIIRNIYPIVVFVGCQFCEFKVRENIFAEPLPFYFLTPFIGQADVFNAARFFFLLAFYKEHNSHTGLYAKHIVGGSGYLWVRTDIALRINDVAMGKILLNAFSETIKCAAVNETELLVIKATIPFLSILSLAQR